MSSTLQRVAATQEDLNNPKVRALTFGKDPWDEYIGKWLFGQTGDFNDSAAGCMACGGHVWFWVETAEGPTNGKVVGVSSFGTASVRGWPTKKVKECPASIAPALGVDLSCRKRGYGRLIVEDVLAEAKSVAHLRPVIVFYVDAENPALKWYKDVFKFVEHGKPLMVGERPHPRLVLAVNQPPTVPT